MWKYIAHNLLDIKVLGSYSQQPSSLRRPNTRERGYMLPRPILSGLDKEQVVRESTFQLTPYPALLACYLGCTFMFLLWLVFTGQLQIPVVQKSLQVTKQANV
jgi:hypothetical protein